MAAPWAAGAVCRVKGRLHGQDVINVWHFATNTVINDEQNLNTLLLQLAQAMLDCAVQFLLPAVTSDYTLIDVEAQRITPTPSDPVIATAPANSVGELSATSVSFASSLVNLRTGGGGRRGRGKKFLPPPGEAEVASSAIDNPTLVLIAAYLTCVAGKFFEGQATTDWRVGVYSKKNDSEITGTFDNSFRAITQMSPSQDLAVMRSRRRGHGN